MGHKKCSAFKGESRKLSSFLKIYRVKEILNKGDSRQWTLDSRKPPSGCSSTNLPVNGGVGVYVCVRFSSLWQHPWNGRKEEGRDADKNRCMRSLLPHFSEDTEMVLKHAPMVTYLTSVRAVGVGGYITAIVSESE